MNVGYYNKQIHCCFYFLAFRVFNLHIHHKNEIFKEIASTSIVVREPLNSSKVVFWLKSGNCVPRKDPDSNDEFEAILGSSAHCDDDNKPITLTIIYDKFKK